MCRKRYIDRLDPTSTVSATTLARSGHAARYRKGSGQGCVRRTQPLRGLTSVSGRATALRVFAPGGAQQTSGEPREGACSPPTLRSGAVRVERRARHVVAGSAAARQTTPTRRRPCPTTVIRSSNTASCAWTQQANGDSWRSPCRQPQRPAAALCPAGGRPGTCHADRGGLPPYASVAK
ncbi:hypothetical protein D3C72_1385750 [compost metagenome]